MFAHEGVILDVAELLLQVGEVEVDGVHVGDILAVETERQLKTGFDVGHDAVHA